MTDGNRSCSSFAFFFDLRSTEMQLAIEVLASKFHTVVNPRQTASDYMMSGMLRCRLCGKLLTVRYNSEKGKGYYVCKARKEDGIAGCELPYVNIERFDKKFLEVMLEDILAPGNVKGAIDQIANELSGPYEQQVATVSALEDQISKVKDQQDRVMVAYEAGAYTVTDFAKRMDLLRSAEAELASKKKEAERQLDQQAAIIAQPATVLEFARDVGEFIKHSTPKERKQVLKRFVKCVWIEPGKTKKGKARAKIVYRIPLPRDAGKSRNSELELALGEEPVSPSTLLSLALLARTPGRCKAPRRCQRRGLHHRNLHHHRDSNGPPVDPRPSHHQASRPGLPGPGRLLRARPGTQADPGAGRIHAPDSPALRRTGPGPERVEWGITRPERPGGETIRLDQPHHPDGT